MNKENYREDHKGRFVPIGLIDEVDLQRDSLVTELVEKAKELKASMIEFKKQSTGDVMAFCELSADKYGVKRGGKKGNVCLVSFDGKLKVQIAVAELIVFDERLHAAKELIDECLTEWTEGSRDEIKALITDAFQVDKEGNISTGRILGLRRLKINDPRWIRAMDAISESVRVADTKSYLRFYEKTGLDDKWTPICLDMAAV